MSRSYLLSIVNFLVYIASIMFLFISFAAIFSIFIVLVLLNMLLLVLFLSCLVSPFSVAGSHSAIFYCFYSLPHCLIFSVVFGFVCHCSILYALLFYSRVLACLIFPLCHALFLVSIPRTAIQFWSPILHRTFLFRSLFWAAFLYLCLRLLFYFGYISLPHRQNHILHTISSLRGSHTLFAASLCSNFPNYIITYLPYNLR